MKNLTTKYYGVDETAQGFEETDDILRSLDGLSDEEEPEEEEVPETPVVPEEKAPEPLAVDYTKVASEMLKAQKAEIEKEKADAEAKKRAAPTGNPDQDLLDELEVTASERRKGEIYQELSTRAASRVYQQNRTDENSASSMRRKLAMEVSGGDEDLAEIMESKMQRYNLVQLKGIQANEDDMETLQLMAEGLKSKGPEARAPVTRGGRQPARAATPSVNDSEAINNLVKVMGIPKERAAQIVRQQRDN